jgi:hypothetical protein
VIVLQETTRWPDGQGGNHIYILNAKTNGVKAFDRLGDIDY